MQRSDGALIGLLCQIIGISGIAEIATHPPDIGLSVDDELLECAPIATLGVEQQLSQPVHDDILPNREPNARDLRPLSHGSR